MLSVRDLEVRFTDRREVDEAVRGVSFDMAPGEILGIVGESGSGKSVTARAIMGLLRRRSAEVSGQILFQKQNLLTLPDEQMRRLQGKRVSMVFQEPKSALNPLMKIGQQVEEGLRLHSTKSKAERKAMAIAAMTDMELSDPERVYNQYPHELSGGMRQRVMLGAALITEPELLICDEPTTALDVCTQGQILTLLQEVQATRGMGILFISHDLQVIRSICRRAIVMQDGRIVEQGDVEALFTSPKEAYTQKLLDSIPGRGRRRA